MKVIFRLAGALSALAASLVLNLSKSVAPNGAPVFLAPPALLRVAAVLLAVWAFYESSEKTVDAVRAKLRRREDRIRRQGESALVGMLPDFLKRAQVDDPTLVGLHAFLVKRRFRVTRWPFVYQVQVHLARVRFGETRPAANPSFEKGKGVVGLCWSSRRFAAKDMRRFVKSHKNVTTRTEWDALPQDVRMGMSYAELEELRKDEAPRVILAAPMICAEGYIGCVTLDAPSEYAAAFINGEAKRDVKRWLEIVANTVKDLASG